jgi:hypothetical protein
VRLGVLQEFLGESPEDRQGTRGGLRPGIVRVNLAMPQRAPMLVFLILSVFLRPVQDETSARANQTILGIVLFSSSLSLISLLARAARHGSILHKVSYSEVIVSERIAMCSKNGGENRSAAAALCNS